MTILNRIKKKDLLIKKVNHFTYLSILKITETPRTD